MNISPVDGYPETVINIAYTAASKVQATAWKAVCAAQIIYRKASRAVNIADAARRKERVDISRMENAASKKKP